MIQAIELYFFEPKSLEHFHYCAIFELKVITNFPVKHFAAIIITYIMHCHLIFAQAITIMNFIITNFVLIIFLSVLLLLQLLLMHFINYFKINFIFLKNVIVVVVIINLNSIYYLN